MPSLISLDLSHNCLDKATTSAITNSATERELEKGELKTAIPALAAANKST